jgi:hypothetical protein
VLVPWFSPLAYNKVAAIKYVWCSKYDLDLISCQVKEKASGVMGYLQKYYIVLSVACSILNDNRSATCYLHFSLAGNHQNVSAVVWKSKIK